MTNAGVTGEDTLHGTIRLPSALNPSAQQPPQVLLLMEGANDINGANPASVAIAVANLESMVRTAKASGLSVILGTLPPENPNACTGPGVPAGCVNRGTGAILVVPFNTALKSMAATEAVVVADV